MGRRVTGSLACMVMAGALAGWSSAASAATWFRESDIATNTPPTTKCGEPKSGSATNIGGEASAVFDVNGDGSPDIVIVNGSDYYFVALGHRNPNGSVSYPTAATAHQIGVTGDQLTEKSKALGLTDFNRDGKLDLYIGNAGDGTIGLKNPRDLADAYNPANLDTAHLCEDHRYRTYENNGDGTFSYRNIGDSSSFGGDFGVGAVGSLS